MANRIVSIPGEMLADLKRREIATIDADLLKPNREEMDEGLEQLNESALHSQPNLERHLAPSPQQLIPRHGGGICLLS
jgi:hypothetical protein